MVRKTTRPRRANEAAEQTAPVDRRAKALKLFWAMFYFRLLLFAVSLPFLVMAVLDVGVSVFQPNRRPIFIEPLLNWVLAAVLGVAGLRIAAIICYGIIPPLGTILLAVLEYTVIPLLAFVRDVFTDTPRTFFARGVEFALGPRRQPPSTFFSVFVPFVILCGIFAYILLSWKSILLN